MNFCFLTVFRFLLLLFFFFFLASFLVLYSIFSVEYLIHFFFLIDLVFRLYIFSWALLYLYSLGFIIAGPTHHQFQKETPYSLLFLDYLLPNKSLDWQNLGQFLCPDFEGNGDTEFWVLPPREEFIIWRLPPHVGGHICHKYDKYLL